MTVSPSNLKSQIRDNFGALISELVVSTTEIEGSYLLTASSTVNWPVNVTLYMDVQLNIDGQVSSSETIEITVVKDVTQ